MQAHSATDRGTSISQTQRRLFAAGAAAGKWEKQCSLTDAGLQKDLQAAKQWKQIQEVVVLAVFQIEASLQDRK